MTTLIVEPNGQGGLCHYTYCLAGGLHAADERIVLATAHPYELAAAPHGFPVMMPFGPGRERRLAQWVLAQNASRRHKPQDGPEGGEREPMGGLGGVVSRSLAALEYRRALHACMRMAPRLDAPVVHFQWLQASAATTRALNWLKRRGVATVLTAHNVLPHEATPVVQTAWASLYQSVDALIVHYQRAADELASLGVEERRISVIPHGNYLPIAALSSGADAGEQSQRQSRRRLDLPEDVPLVLFFGLIRPYKGVEYLLDAFVELRRRIPQARLLLAGRAIGGFGPFAERITRLRLGDAVISLPRYLSLEEMGWCMSAADVVALPYVEATQSGVAQMAYAYSKPVIATSVGGLPDVVRDGVTGRLVPPRDTHALADALADALQDKAWREALGARAYAFARDACSWTMIAEKTAALYRSTLESKHQS